MVIGNLACVTHGAAIVIPSDSFDVLATLRTIQDESCTSVLGVPTMFISVLANPAFDDFDLSTLRTGMMAGAPCPTEVMKRCINEMHMPEITIGYGMTETSPVSTQTSADDPIDRRVETVGRVHPHVELKIVDVDSGVTVDLGEPGELCTRGYSVMLGYWDDPQRTAEAVDPDGWMHSGDLATLDSDGYVRIVGRIKDLIIRGGENISPREIEEFLHTMPGVVDAHVIGVPDRVYGEELMAWVRVSAGVTLTRDDVVAFSTGRIAHFKIPRYLHVTDDFPMTVTGKIQKYKMRELSIDLLDATTVTT
jgi:fatty-acyl-CoA synthase